MLRVFVALGKQEPKDKFMVEQTKEVARLLAKYNCTLVQGGAKTGLMGAVAQEFAKYSDEVVMIVPEVHKSDLEGTIHKEAHIVNSETDRLNITINTCDMMVVLPGGTGTLAELSVYNETLKSGEHKAKLVMVNTKGYYNTLVKFYGNMAKNNFAKKEHFMFEVIKEAKQLEPILKSLITEKQAKIQQEEIKLETKEGKIMATKKVAKKQTAKAEPKKATKKVVKAEPKVEVKVEKKVPAKKPVAKKVEVKKEVKVEKVAPKKAEAKKVEPKKAPAKKVEVKKAEPKKVEVKKEVKPVAKKAPAKKVAKVEPKAEVKVEKKAPAKKPVAKKVEVKKEAKVEKVAPKKAPAKKVEAKKEVKAEKKAPAKKPVKKSK